MYGSDPGEFNASLVAGLLLAGGLPLPLANSGAVNGESDGIIRYAHVCSHAPVVTLKSIMRIRGLARMPLT